MTTHLKKHSAHRPTQWLGLVLGLGLLSLGAFSFAGCGETPEKGGRVLVLGLDGLDPQTVDLLVSEGTMPNFARLREAGAYGPLRSQKPLLSPIIWTTIATGKTADQHGIGHFVARDASGESLPVTSNLRRVEALWTIASAAERRVATVGWWATWPPEAVHGTVVSDHAAYHFLFKEGLSSGDRSSDRAGEQITHPPALAEEIAPLLRRPESLTAAQLARYVDVPAEEIEQPFDFTDELAHFRWALATAESYRDIGLKLWREEQPDLELVYIEGTDSTSHLFGHLFRAEGLGGELAEQERRYGRAVEEIYRFADELVGEYLAALDDRTTLVVLSDHGFELGALHDDPTQAGDLRRVSERFHRELGILYLYGRGVRPGSEITGATILDIAPTVLGLLGLPAGEDMPGRFLSEAFSEVTAPERIASWEKGVEAPRAEPEASDAVTGNTVRQAQLDHLKSLGYLGGTSADVPTSDSSESQRNLAAIHFRQGEYRQAARLYLRLVDESPDDSALRASLAGTLGALGRYDEAIEHLDRAIALDPLNVGAYHNRAVLAERQGRAEDAVEDYRRALRYAPAHRPSQEALLRLTGSADLRAPRNAQEREAAILLQQASDAARRGRYGEALTLLDQAEDLAPDYVLVHQYRSNVAHLQGDLEAGIAALERALELEPDNALFQRNLEDLKRRAAQQP